MVTMIGIYPPTSQALDSQQLGHEFAALISPLTRIVEASDLDSLITRTAPQFANLRSRMSPTSSSPSQQAISVREASNLVFSGIRARIEAKTDLFDDATKETLLGALESLEAFTSYNLDALDEGERGLQKVLPILQIVGTKALHADMIVSAVQFIIFDLSPDWREESIPLLVEAFDEAMVEIEDYFLDYSRSDQEDDGGFADLNTVRSELGL